MGVTLDLRLIDHERIAVRGLQIVNDAIRHNDPARLRNYLASLPIDVDPAIVEYRTARLAKLREVDAPPIIIENEERLLRQANGDTYRPEKFAHATLDELRQLLGTWCWISHSYSLDKAWDELHWFLEPRAGPDQYPLHPLRPNFGDPQASLFSQAFHGAVHYPKDDLGDPVIRTLGSNEPDCSGYNPPDIASFIHEASERIDPAAWDEHVPFRRELYGRAYPDMGDEEIAERVEDELSFARDAFAVFVTVYSKAAAAGYGVSCEYSL